MTDMRVPVDRPAGLAATADKIAAAVLLKQSLEKLGEEVPSWVGELAASQPTDNGARVSNGPAPAPPEG